MVKRKSRALVEQVEARLLFAAVTFDVVQGQSSISLGGTVSVTTNGNTTTRNIQTQGPGSLTQSYTGTIATDISGNTIRFVGGSNVAAASTAGIFLPEGNLPQANYAGKIINLPLPLIGAADVFFAMRNATFDLTSANRTMNASGQFPTAGITIQPLQGSVRYSAGPLAGQEFLAEQSIVSAATTNSSLVVTNGVARLTLPATMTMTQAITALGSNVNGTINLTGQVVAIARTGSLKGTIYNDANGNGRKDSGEAGIANRIVYLDTNNNGVKEAAEASATTNAQGAYLFSMLAGGSYTVRVHNVVAPQRVSTPWLGFHTAVVTNQQVTTKDFGLTTLAAGSVSGIVWNDVNADALAKAGETRLANTRVYVDLDNDSVYDADEPTDLTDANGFYQIDNLPTGTDLIVRRNLPLGNFYATPATGTSHTVNLASGQTRTGVNFGQTTTKGIRGTVFNDINDNGVQDNGEPGLVGVVVWLDANNNGVKDGVEVTQTTGGGGAFRFATPPVGVNRVRIQVPAGNRITFPSKVPHVINYVANTLASANYGLTTKGRISGIVFQALNTNGVRDSNEPLLSGRTVFLDLDLDGVKDATEPSVLSPTSGNWTFNNLAAGNYRVRVIVPATNAAVTPVFYNVTLAAGQIVSNIVFGMINN